MPTINFVDPASDAVNNGTIDPFWEEAFGALGEDEDNRDFGAANDVFEQTLDSYIPDTIDFNFSLTKNLRNRGSLLIKDVGTAIHRVKYQNTYDINLTTNNVSTVFGFGTNGLWLTQTLFFWPGREDANSLYLNGFVGVNGDLVDYFRCDASDFSFSGPNDEAISSFDLNGGDFIRSVTLDIEFIWSSIDGLYKFTVNGEGPFDLPITPSDIIESDGLGTGTGSQSTFSNTFTILPIDPNSVSVFAGAVSGADDGAGNITGTGIASGSVNYSTGEVSVTFSSPPAMSQAVGIEYFSTPSGQATKIHIGSARINAEFIGT